MTIRASPHRVQANHLVTSTSTPTAPEEATLGTMPVGIKDLDLDLGPLRMLPTSAVYNISCIVTLNMSRAVACMPLTATSTSAS